MLRPCCTHANPWKRAVAFAHPSQQKRPLTHSLSLGSSSPWTPLVPLRLGERQRSGSGESDARLKRCCLSDLVWLGSHIVQQYYVGAVVSAKETPLVTPRTWFAHSFLANTNTVRRVSSLQGFVPLHRRNTWHTLVPRYGYGHLTRRLWIQGGGHRPLDAIEHRGSIASVGWRFRGSVRRTFRAVTPLALEGQ